MHLTTTPPGATLVVFSGTESGWCEHIPPAPDDLTVTVSLSHAHLSEAHTHTLAVLGYEVVGTVPLPAELPRTAPTSPTAAFLVPGELRAQRPRWLRALLEGASAVYDLTFGPVALALAEVTAVHVAHHARARG